MIELLTLVTNHAERSRSKAEANSRGNFLATDCADFMDEAATWISIIREIRVIRGSFFLRTSSRAKIEISKAQGIAEKFNTIVPLLALARGSNKCPCRFCP
jgi:hypothetical protein